MLAGITVGDPTQLSAALISRIYLSMASPDMLSKPPHDDYMRSTLHDLADTGVDATKTPHHSLIHDFQPVRLKKYMADASQKHNASLGQGFIKIRSNGAIHNQPCYVMVHLWLTPFLPVAMFPTAARVERHKDQLKGYLTTLDHMALT
jgi:hypothetical protein